MTLSQTTGAVLLVNVLALVAWDVYVKVKRPDGSATISWVTLTACKHFPIIAAGLGLVLGHLLWQNCTVP